MKRPYVLNECTWKDIQSQNWAIAVLPWGATEAHNYHLPYSTDCIEAESVSIMAAEKAWNRGAKVMVLPCVPFGVNCPQIKVPFNINMNPSTQFLVLRDIVDSLERQGIKKLVIINAHGGNSFSHMVRELTLSHSVMTVVVDWHKSVDSKHYFVDPGQHAGELETSVVMHLQPELVRPLEEAGSGSYKKFSIDALNEGWAWAQRGWLGEITEDTGIGSPKNATAENGKVYLKATTDKIADLLCDLAHLKQSDLYK